MAYFEFPHTRTYDSDLGWLIRSVSETLNNINNLLAFETSANSDLKTLKRQLELLLEKFTEPITEWDPTVAYSMYSMVTYQGEMFVAVQNVPVGVGIGDTRYWEPASGIQTQIAAMQITLNELDGTFDTVRGGTIAPVYMGDWLENASYLPSVAYKQENTIYTISSFNDGSNNGILRSFNVNTNTAGTTKTVKCGHCNSLTYYPRTDKYYIAPVWDYSHGDPVNVTYLYVYDSTFTTYTEMSIPTQAMSVTYDPVMEVLYYFDYSGNVYSYDPTALAWSIAYTINRPTEYNQDFAIYNNYYFLSAPNGNIIRGVLGKDVENYQLVMKTDIDLYWKLGELEGFEFDESGHLITCIYTILTDCKNGFVTELPVGMAPAYYGRDHYSRVNYLLTLDSESVSAFRLNSARCRSVNQLRALFDEPSGITVASNITEDRAIRTSQDLRFIITAGCSYSCKSWAVDSGELNINGSTTGTIIFTTDGNYPMTLLRAGSIRFGSAVNISLPNKTNGNLIDIPTSFPRIVVRDAPVSTDGYNLNIAGSRILKSRSEYLGTYKVMIGYQSGDVATRIEAGNTVSDEYEVTFDQAFRETPSVQLTTFTSTTNGNNVGWAVLTNLTTTGFKFKVWRRIDTTVGGNAAPSVHWLAFERSAL